LRPYALLGTFSRCRPCRAVRESRADRAQRARRTPSLGERGLETYTGSSVGRIGNPSCGESGFAGRLSSVNLVARPDRLRQDRLSAFVLDELEDNLQIISGALGPGTRQFALQLVRLQRGVESVLRQRFQRRLEGRGGFWMLLQQPPRCPREGRRLQEEAPHFKISRISSSGVAGEQRASYGLGRYGLTVCWEREQRNGDFG
jgi:hypothetical protein